MLVCNNCGQENPINSATCSFCGENLSFAIHTHAEQMTAQLPNQQEGAVSSPNTYITRGSGKIYNPGKAFSIAAFIMGVLGFFPYVGLICAVAGLVLGIIGKKKTVSAGCPYEEAAKAGIIVPCIAVCFSIILIIIMFIKFHIV